MEISWLNFLGGLELASFADRSGMRYTIHNPRTGKTYLTNAETADILHRLQQWMSGAAVEKPDADDMKAAYGFVQNIREMGNRELRQKKPFNPLFMRWEAFDLGHFDAPLERLANALAPYAWPVFWALFAVCCYFGVNSDWKILAEASAGISLAGIASFALVSPLLKIPHELGHALVARRASVNLRSAGLIFVGLYPMPYVDCSMADLQANRNDRIRISLAGVFVDLVIAMVFFVAWYMVDGAFWKTLFANIFIFSSLNSLLFNGNPLIKLDGYYAFSDWIGQRNLATAATASLKRMTRFITTLGAAGSLPAGRKEVAFAFFAALSSLYKINILLTVVWLMLPKFFGVGVLIALWGGYALFFAPFFNQDKTARMPSMNAAAKRRAGFFYIGLSGAIALCLLIKLPLIAVIPVSLDVDNHYRINVREAGIVDYAANSGRLMAEAPLATLSNLVLDQETVVTAKRLEAVELLHSSVAQLDPTQTRVAAEQLVAVRTEFRNLKKRSANLSVTASRAGLFHLNPALRTGVYVDAGVALGTYFPVTGRAQLTGVFPEKRLKQLRASDASVQLWIAGETVDISRSGDISVIQESVTDVEQGDRSYRITLQVDMPPADLIGKDMWAKIDMGPVPIHTHIKLICDDLLRSFRTAQLQQLS